MLIAHAIIKQRALLDGFLRDVQRDVDGAVITCRGRFNRQFDGVQQVTRVSASLVQQVLAGFFIKENLALAITELLICQCAFKDDRQLFLGKRFELENA